ncbi:hypothetical protein [Secundilactobacillus muriivasis]
MKLTKQLAIAMVSAGVFSGVLTGVQGTSASAKATAKVLQVKTIQTANYKAVKGANGYLYSTAKLTKKVHNVKNYSNTKFSVSKEAVVRKTNGNKAIYYYVKSAKASGWLWHGYLNKVTPKTASDAKISALEQQIAELSQRLSALQSQLAASTPAAPVTSSADVTKLQAQIDSLQGQLSAVKGSVGAGNTNATDTNKSGDSDATEPDNSGDSTTVTDKDPFSGTATEYYISSPGSSLYLYPDAQGKGYPKKLNENGKVIKTIKVYAKGEVNADNPDYPIFWFYSNTMLFGNVPVEYDGEKGFVRGTDVTIVPVDTPFYQLGNTPDNAGAGNMAPTDPSVQFTHELANNAIWTQYTEDAKSGNTIMWYYRTATKTWSQTFERN